MNVTPPIQDYSYLQRYRIESVDLKQGSMQLEYVTSKILVVLLELLIHLFQMDVSFCLNTITFLLHCLRGSMPKNGLIILKSHHLSVSEETHHFYSKSLPHSQPSFAYRVVVKATLDHCLCDNKKKEKDKDPIWLLNSKTDFTPATITKRVNSWKKITSRGPQCCGTEQQMVFVVGVGHHGSPRGLPATFPIIGPMFVTKSIEYAALQAAHCSSVNIFAKRFNKLVTTHPAQDYWVQNVHAISPTFYPHLKLDKCFCMIYDIECNYVAIGLEYTCSIQDHDGWSTTSHNQFWNDYEPWELVGEIGEHLKHESNSYLESSDDHNYTSLGCRTPHSVQSQLREYMDTEKGGEFLIHLQLRRYKCIDGCYT
ncbi:hypothetical protein M422DRAFT_40998 [Sphaerobolus stellatus SS14]|nr:hypothetical protein M422DRAFT_40998 [Sphaerobolus stellatus SS14]